MSVHPSCYRSQAKRDRTPKPEWVKALIAKAYTREQWLEIFRSLDGKYKVDKLIETHVDKKIISDNKGLQINLILTGIEGKRVIQGQIVANKELLEHDTE